MTFNAKGITQLQVVENITYKRITEAGDNAPIIALPGEIGSSHLITRIMESKLLFTRNILEGINNINQQILKESKI